MASASSMTSQWKHDEMDVTASELPSIENWNPGNPYACRWSQHGSKRSQGFASHERWSIECFTAEREVFKRSALEIAWTCCPLPNLNTGWSLSSTWKKIPESSTSFCSDWMSTAFSDAQSPQWRDCRGPRWPSGFRPGIAKSSNHETELNHKTIVLSLLSFGQSLRTRSALLEWRSGELT